MNFAFMFDIAAGCLLAFFAVRGAIRGLSGEIVALVGLVASVFCGWTCAQPAAGIVLEYFPSWDATVVALICSVAIFMGVSLLFAFAGRLLHLLIRAANLSMADHLFGTFAGALRAFFVVLFIYGAVSIFSPILPSDWMRESYAMRGAAVVWPPVIAFLSDRGWVDLERLAPAKLEVSIRRMEAASADIALHSPVSSPVSSDILAVPAIPNAPAREGN